MDTSAQLEPRVLLLSAIPMDIQFFTFCFVCDQELLPTFEFVNVRLSLCRSNESTSSTDTISYHVMMSRGRLTDGTEVNAINIHRKTRGGIGGGMHMVETYVRNTTMAEYGQCYQQEVALPYYREPASPQVHERCSINGSCLCSTAFTATSYYVLVPLVCSSGQSSSDCVC